MLQAIKQSIYRVLALSAIRVPAAWLMRVAKANPVPALGPVPTARSVLVFAPHMDDETIGCGGALCAHVRAGSAVHVVFVTDGVRGFEPQRQRTLPEQQRRALRVDESEAACAVLGVSGTHYLDLPDGKSQVDQGSVRAIVDIIEAVQPDLVYLPFITDTHHDHQTCNHLFFAACAELPKLNNLLCHCYEVWTPLHPNYIVDITSDIDKKLEALACYKSQLEMNNYLASVRGLNAYRSMANRSQGYAEAFYVTNAGNYRALAEGL